MKATKFKYIINNTLLNNTIEEHGFSDIRSNSSKKKIERCQRQDGKIRKVLYSQIKLHGYQEFKIELLKQNFKHNSLLALGINRSHGLLGLIPSATSGRVMFISFFGQKQDRAFLNNSLLIKLRKNWTCPFHQEPNELFP